MAAISNWLKESAWIKLVVHDLFIVSIIGIVALCGGLAINQFRKSPLPLVYSSRAERMQNAVEKLNGTGTDSRMLGSGQRPPVTATIGNLDIKELCQIIESKVKVVLLDARPEIFHRLGHIPGAISLPREEFDKAYSKNRVWLEGDKSQIIVVYCSDSDCEDSQMVADGLAKLGYAHVSVFRGGWSEWTEAHQPEETAP